jgi:hypothetical protein
MMLELKDEEIDLLRDLAESAYGDLREEIYKTEATDYKAHLRKREAFYSRRSSVSSLPPRRQPQTGDCAVCAEATRQLGPIRSLQGVGHRAFVSPAGR